MLYSTRNKKSSIAGHSQGELGLKTILSVVHISLHESIFMNQFIVFLSSLSDPNFIQISCSALSEAMF